MKEDNELWGATYHYSRTGGRSTGNIEPEKQIARRYYDKVGSEEECVKYYRGRLQSQMRTLVQHVSGQLGNKAFMARLVKYNVRGVEEVMSDINGLLHLLKADNNGL